MRRLFPLLLCLVTGAVSARSAPLPPSKVDFAAFMALAEQVQGYREERLLHVDEFLAAAQAPDTVILDARSREMYDEMHLAGAIHLDFSDFTASRLRELIPDPDTRILIYCNNNFAQAPRVFATKVSSLNLAELTQRRAIELRALADADKDVNSESTEQAQREQKRLPLLLASQKNGGNDPLTLALNIPTFINLYGYGYRNVYELADFVPVADPRLRFEGRVVDEPGRQP